MADYNQVLVAILLVLTCVLVAFLIYVCIKLLMTADKVNTLLQDLQKKLRSVDGIFTTIDQVSNAVSTVSDAVVTKIVQLIEKLFVKKEKTNESEE